MKCLTNNLLLLFITGLISAASQAADKPNIIFIVADDLGYNDVGFNGGQEIATPNTNSIADGGVKFTNGYVTCPVCSPTRAGLLTARYQQRFGHEFNPGPVEGTEDSKKFGLPLTEVTLASALKEQGYATGIVGKWHLGFEGEYLPNRRGFDEFFGFLGGAHPYVPLGATRTKSGIYRNTDEIEHPEYLTDAIGDEASAFVKRHASQPFFLYLTFNAVHNPAQATDKYLQRVASIGDEKRRVYAAMLTALDDNVGKVLGAVRAEKLEDKTLIVFISDNGGPTKANSSNNTPLHGDKGTVWEGGIRVPYAIQWKGKLPAGKVYDAPVLSLDATATAAAIAGAKLGGGKPIDGVNLLPHVLGENANPPHKALYWRFGERHAIRLGNYKLLDQGDGDVKLFDLASDIGEQNDLTGSKPEIKAELEKEYQAWNSQLADPLWKRGAAQRQTRRQARNEKIDAQ